MFMPTIDASDEMFDVRLLLVAVSGASITDALYSLGVPKLTASPRMAEAIRNTDIISLSLRMALSRPMKSMTIFFLFLFSSIWQKYIST